MEAIKKIYKSLNALEILESDEVLKKTREGIRTVFAVVFQHQIQQISRKKPEFPDLKAAIEEVMTEFVRKKTEEWIKKKELHERFDNEKEAIIEATKLDQLEKMIVAFKPLMQKFHNEPLKSTPE